MIGSCYALAISRVGACPGPLGIGVAGLGPVGIGRPGFRAFYIDGFFLPPRWLMRWLMRRCTKIRLKLRLNSSFYITWQETPLDAFKRLVACGYKKRHTKKILFSITVFFTDTDDSQDSMGREGTIFYSTLPLPPAHEH